MPHGSKNVRQAIEAFEKRFGKSLKEKQMLHQTKWEVFQARCECGYCHARKKAGLKCTNPNCILNRS